MGQPPAQKCSTECLKKNFQQKLSAHYQHLDDLRLPASPRTVGPTAAAQWAAELVNAAARIRARTKELSQEYVREIRSALRLVGPAFPMVARVIEGAVKGLVVTLDKSMSAGWEQADRLEQHTHKLEDEKMETKMLLQKVRELEDENAQLKEALATSEQRCHDESRHMQQKIDVLHEEIERLSPDQSHLEGVAGLMGEYNLLMMEMLEESHKQSKIMDNMTNYTKNVVGDAVAKDRRKTKHGRVVEIANGELMLRPHDVEDRSTQVIDMDLRIIDPEAPIRLRMPRVRQIMTAFASE